jgi:hypothetical protein
MPKQKLKHLAYSLSVAHASFLVHHPITNLHHNSLSCFSRFRAKIYSKPSRAMSELMLAQATSPNIQARRAMQRLNIRRQKRDSVVQKSSKVVWDKIQCMVASHKDTAPSGTPTSNDLSMSPPEPNPYTELSEDELYEKFRNDGPVLADHSEKTKAAKKSEEAKWIA